MLSSQLRVWSLPQIHICIPFFKYFSTNSANLEYVTIFIKSVCLSSPCLTYFLFTASVKFANFVLFVCEYLISGSFVNLPSNIVQKLNIQN